MIALVHYAPVVGIWSVVFICVLAFNHGAAICRKAEEEL